MGVFPLTSMSIESQAPKQQLVTGICQAMLLFIKSSSCDADIA